MMAIQIHSPIGNTGMSSKTLVRPQHRTQMQTRKLTPPRGKVVVLNDDYTPMDFVVAVLKRFFHLGHERAMALMLQVHQQGSAVAGEYALEIAEARADQVNGHARQHQYPLLCVVERITP